jgi:hypothetical protein
MRLHHLAWAAVAAVTAATAPAGAIAAAGAETKNPYAGQERRTVKALSADEIEGLREGAGLGFAKSAELNSYPGPLHALDLAGELGLTAAQIDAITAARREVKAEAVRLGPALLEAEARLETVFAEKRADGPEVFRLLGEIAAIYAKLRFVHLNAHIRIRPLFTPHQIATYDRLRGYADGGAGGHDPARHGGH